MFSAQRSEWGAARLIAAAVVALGVALRVWFVWHAPAVTGDTLLYGDVALNWMRSGVYGFSQDGGAIRPTLIRLPGYPLFLMLSFRLFGAEHYRAVMLLQALVDLGTWGLMAGLASRLLGRRAGMAALVLGMLCPFPAMYVSLVLAETATLFTMALVFFSLERWSSCRIARGAGWNRWLVPLTLGLAYGLLLRPDQGLMAAAVVPAMLWVGWRGRARGVRRGLRWAWPAVAVAVGTLLPLAPWTVRNWRTFHVVQPLAPKYATDPGELVPLGFDGWFRTWGVDFASTDEVYWNYDGTAIAIGDLPRRAFDSPAQYQETAKLLRDYNLTTNPTPALEARFAAIARERIEGHWWRYYVGLPAARLLNMMFRPRTEIVAIETRWWRFGRHPGKTLLVLAGAGVNLLYFVMGAWGLGRMLRGGGRGGPVVWAMVAFVVLRCCLLLTIDNSEPRYTLEFFPVLVLGWAGWFGRKQRVAERV